MNPHETTKILAQRAIELSVPMPGLELPHGFTDTPVEVEGMTTRVGDVERVPARDDGPLCLALVPFVRLLGVMPPLAHLPADTGLWHEQLGDGWVQAFTSRGMVHSLDTINVRWLGLSLSITHRQSGCSIGAKHPRQDGGRRGGREQTMVVPATLAGLEIISRVHEHLAGILDWSVSGTQLRKVKGLSRFVDEAWAPEVDALFKIEQADAKRWRAALNKLDWKPEHGQAAKVRHAVWSRFFWAAKP
jgi:hypothetical protein